MQYKVVLKDGTQFTTEDGSFIGAITTICADDATASALCAKFNDANISDVKWYVGEDTNPFNSYTDLVMEKTPTRSTNSDGKVTVYVSLRESTYLEKQIRIALSAIEDLTVAVLS